MSPLVVRLGTLVSLAIVGLQWLIVAGFVSHSFAWWVKADAPTITAGTSTTAIWASGVILALAYSSWAYDRLSREKAAFRYVALVSSLAGSAGFLVFAGMAASGLLQLVNR